MPRRSFGSENNRVMTQTCEILKHCSEHIRTLMSHHLFTNTAPDPYLPRLHLLGSSSEGHIGVAGAGAISLLLLHIGDEDPGLEGFSFAAPVVKHLFDQLIILLQ